MYKVNEIFYSLKGEGAWSGTPMAFVRFAGCNVNCKFCDTDHESFEEMTRRDIWHEVKKVSNQGSDRIVLTGGEPLLQVDRSLTGYLTTQGFKLHLETNGTLWPFLTGNPFDWVCVSPKSCEVDIKALWYCDELKFLCGQWDWKDTIDGVMKQAPPLEFCAYLLMPLAKSIKEGDRSKTDIIWDNTSIAVKYCLEHPEFSLTIQLHKYLGIK